jgi:FkbM family methyltransferase
MERPNRTGAEKRVAFVLASTDQGAFIINRLDYFAWRYREECDAVLAGIGSTDFNICGTSGYLLEASAYDPEEAQLTCKVLSLRRKHHGDGVVAIDCGANIGVFSVVWGQHMAGWGRLLAIEPQERIYYALCGNIALRNCWNVQALKAVVMDKNGVMSFMEPDYVVMGGFSSLSFKEDTIIGQDLDASRRTAAQAITIDSLGASRIDFIKLDLEGMEIEALRGAVESIARFKPVLSVEVMRDQEHGLAELLEGFGYQVPDWTRNTRHLICVHPDDPIRPDLASLHANP